MKLPSPATLWLQLRFSLHRFGWGNLAACLLPAIALGGLLFWLPYRQALNQQQQQQLRQAQTELAKPVPETPPPQISGAEKNLLDFYNHLGEERYNEQQIKTIFAAAQQSGITLNQGEYKSSYNRQGRFYQYQIILPVKADYRAIRQFCQKVLLAIPFAALDEINFKRDNIGNRIVEAKLRFTIYLGGPAPDGVQPSSDVSSGKAEATR